MTILGVHATAERALLWTDSEMIRLDTGEHSAFRNKVVVNGLGGFAVASSGWAGLCAEADRIAMTARDLDHAARILPEPLRQLAVKLVNARGHDARQNGGQTVLLAGWSPAFGRVVAYRLAGFALYTPELVGSFRLPDVPGEGDVPTLARAQMVELRRDYPAARGGVLTLAEITAEGVRTRTLGELGGEPE